MFMTEFQADMAILMSGVGGLIIAAAVIGATAGHLLSAAIIRIAERRSRR